MLTLKYLSEKKPLLLAGLSSILVLAACTNTFVRFSQSVYAADMVFEDVQPIALVVVRSPAVPDKTKTEIKTLSNRITKALDILNKEARELDSHAIFIPQSRIDSDTSLLTATQKDLSSLSSSVKLYRGK